MSNLKLVSSSRLIGELFSDFNIQGTDWLPKAQRHIARAVELMELSGYFKQAISVTTVTDYIAPLPCNMKYLLAVVTISGQNVCILPIRNNIYIGKQFSSYKIASGLVGTINEDTLRTSFETGKVGFIYHTPPLDSSGNPMIPDNAFVMEALPFYVITRLGYSGYLHPVISREEAESKWREFSVRANHVVNFPTIEEMDSFTDMMNNPYYEYCFNYQFICNLEEDTPVILSQDLLAPEPEIAVSSVTYNTNITQAINLETGWIIYGNNLITDIAPFTGLADTPVTFPLSDDIINDSEASNSLRNIINPTTKEIKVNNSGDAFIGRLEFTLITPLASRQGNIYFDIGDGISQIVTFGSSDFTSNADAGVPKNISIVVPFYQLDTFEANEAKIIIEVDGDFSLYNISFFLNKTYNGGQNI